MAGIARNSLLNSKSPDLDSQKIETFQDFCRLHATSFLWLSATPYEE